jgi:hypothetical protein
LTGGSSSAALVAAFACWAKAGIAERGVAQLSETTNATNISDACLLTNISPLHARTKNYAGITTTNGNIGKVSVEDAVFFPDLRIIPVEGNTTAWQLVENGSSVTPSTT